MPIIVLCCTCGSRRLCDLPGADAAAPQPVLMDVAPREDSATAKDDSTSVSGSDAASQVLSGFLHCVKCVDAIDPQHYQELALATLTPLPRCSACGTLRAGCPCD